MDKIFYNGVITTVDPAYPSVTAVCIKGGIIMHVGSDEEMLAYKTEDTELVDLERKFMYPGFIDSHMHMMLDAARGRYLDLTGCESYAAMADILANEAARLRESGGGWVLGTGFNQDFWSDVKRIPSRLDLDKICSDLPIYLERTCGHTAAHNTKALEIMGLMDEKEGKTQYDMLFLEDGTPQGQLFEGDASMVTASFPCPDVEEFKRWIKRKSAQYAALGLVGIHSDDINIIKAGEDLEPQMRAFEEAAREGLMSVRVYEQCRIEQPDALKKFVKRYPRGSAFGTKFETTSIKLMVDGSLGAHSAVLRDGYMNDPGAEGVLVCTSEELNELVQITHDAGYPAVIHCIGDAAVDMALDAIERARQNNPRPDMRHGIVHCQIMRTEQLERMRRNNVLAYAQPIFVRADCNIVDDCVGNEIAKQSYDWRSMMDMGIHTSGGSDCPVEHNDPIINIYYAVTRDDGKGGSWYPENAVSIEEALRMFTIEGAYAGYAEATRGSITVGKYADLVVLDKNLLEIDPKEIPNAKLLMTILEGETVYEV